MQNYILFCYDSKLIKKAFALITIFAFITACSHTSNNGNNTVSAQTNQKILSDTAGKTLLTRFSPPANYKRLTYDKSSFQYYLSNLPLKPINAKVYYYNGQLKPNMDVYASVFDIDVGDRDLQQCADAVMRLRAEYLYKQKRYDEIHFNFTSGFNAEYTKWAEGSRIKVTGNNVSWYKAKEKDYSYNTFKAYLNIVFTYAGTLSLSKEMKSIPIDSMQVGDVFIKGGSPGHAVIIVDIAINNAGKKVFMIAQSYMPAQSIHLLVNPTDKDLSPWFDLSETDKLYSPEWTFQKSELKRFKK